VSRREREAPPDEAAASQRRSRNVSLLGQRAEPGEAPPPRGRSEGSGDQSPGDGSAEARPSREESGGRDPLRSSHSTFHHLQRPRDDFDRARARALCAQIARDALRDFAPALVLLPAATRERAQAVIAHARTLLDFARDPSLEGERLAQINRVEFELEAALGGEPPGQPVFVELAALEREAPWRREAFDELAKVARARVSIGLPRTERTAEAQRRRLAAAAFHAILGDAPGIALETLGAAVLRAASLVAWREGLWYYRPDLGLDAGGAPSPRFAEVVAAESAAILEVVEGPTIEAAIRALPARVRPAVRYARLAAAAIAQRAAALPSTTTLPPLPVATRIALLLRARTGLGS